MSARKAASHRRHAPVTVGAEAPALRTYTSYTQKQIKSGPHVVSLRETKAESESQQPITATLRGLALGLWFDSTLVSRFATTCGEGWAPSHPSGGPLCQNQNQQHPKGCWGPLAPRVKGERGPSPYSLLIGSPSTALRLVPTPSRGNKLPRSWVGLLQIFTGQGPRSRLVGEERAAERKHGRSEPLTPHR